jgi:hypothetical protein
MSSGILDTKEPIIFDDLFKNGENFRIMYWPEEELKKNGIVHNVRLDGSGKRYMFRLSLNSIVLINGYKAKNAQIPSSLIIEVELYVVTELDQSRKFFLENMIFKDRFKVNIQAWERIKYLITKAYEQEKRQLIEQEEFKKCEEFIAKYFKIEKLKGFIKSITIDYFDELFSLETHHYPSGKSLLNAQILASINFEHLIETAFEEFKDTLFDFYNMFFNPSDEKFYDEQFKRDQLSKCMFYMHYPLFKIFDILLYDGDCDLNRRMLKLNLKYNEIVLIFLVSATGYKTRSSAPTTIQNQSALQQNLTTAQQNKSVPQSPIVNKIQNQSFAQIVNSTPSKKK